MRWALRFVCLPSCFLSSALPAVVLVDTLVVFCLVRPAQYRSWRLTCAAAWHGRPSPCFRSWPLWPARCSSAAPRRSSAARLGGLRLRPHGPHCPRAVPACAALWPQMRAAGRLLAVLCSRLSLLTALSFALGSPALVLCSRGSPGLVLLSWPAKRAAAACRCASPSACSSCNSAWTWRVSTSSFRSTRLPKRPALACSACCRQVQGRAH